MKEILLRKLGPLPVWVWSIIGIGVAVWWIKRNQSKSPSASSTNSGTFPNAQPMATQSDVFVNVSVPATAPTNPLPSQTHVRRQPAGITHFRGLNLNPHVMTGIPIPGSAAPGGTPPPGRIKSITYPITQRFQNAVAYAANTGTTEANARQQGYSSTQGGYSVFRGETLVIPR